MKLTTKQIAEKLLNVARKELKWLGKLDEMIEADKVGVLAGVQATMRLSANRFMKNYWSQSQPAKYASPRELTADADVLAPQLIGVLNSAIAAFESIVNGTTAAPHEMVLRSSIDPLIEFFDRALVRDASIEVSGTLEETDSDSYLLATFAQHAPASLTFDANLYADQVIRDGGTRPWQSYREVYFAKVAHDRIAFGAAMVEALKVHLAYSDACDEAKAQPEPKP